MKLFSIRDRIIWIRSHNFQINHMIGTIARASSILFILQQARPFTFTRRISNRVVSTNLNTSSILLTRQQARTNLNMSTNLRTDAKGRYNRHDAKHRFYVKKNSEFPPEANRYHLHIALACPWACGVLAALHLKGLEDVISYSITHPTWQKTSTDVSPTFTFNNY